ncbi:MAG: DUF3788 family protein [Bryobacteraceae bacterium]
MHPNAFVGRAAAPGDQDLANALGPAKVLWDELLSVLEADFQLNVREWNSYSPKAGWSLRLKMKDRNILYLIPYAGGFAVSFALGDRAVRAARESRLPAWLIKNIGESRRYAEGTAVRFEVKSVREVAAVKKLTAIKLEH